MLVSTKLNDGSFLGPLIVLLDPSGLASLGDNRDLHNTVKVECRFELIAELFRARKLCAIGGRF